MPKIKVNGREIDAPADKVLLETCLDHGIDVPHYCWHRGLSPHGNCRMCLVKLSTNPRKPEIACMTRPSEGMEVTTEGPEIDGHRKAVLEYMLVNHPLDCPICDKAGECDLQDFTFKYRDGVSRTKDPRETKGTVDLGPNVKIWGSRCIACTRCVRFCEEIAGTSELSLINRGNHSVAGVHPGVTLDNPMSLNVVDICPVGALIDKNFLYQARVWFAKKTETVCGGCSKGCNVTVTTLSGHLKRIKPRTNPAVNQFWMCDAGRLGWRWVEGPDRLKVARGSVAEAASALSAAFTQHGRGAIGIVASSAQTTESLHLLKQLADASGAVVGFVGATGPEWTSKSGWRIEADKSPNTAGIQRVFGAVPGLDAVQSAAANGQLRALVVVNGLPGAPFPEAFVTAAASVPLRIVADVQDSALAQRAQVVWPLAAWLEEDGTWFNVDGRVQRIHAALPPPGMARAATEWLGALLLELGVRAETSSTSALFAEATGLEWDRVGGAGWAPSASAQPGDAVAQPGAK